MTNIKAYQASLLIDAKSQLGEGPLWHPAEKVLYWVDITPGVLNCWNPATKHVQQWLMGCMIGTVVVSRSEGLIVALETGIHHFSAGKVRTKLVDFPEPSGLNNRFNDGKCDPSGRLWIGTMNKQVRSQAGSLYCFDGLNLTKKLSGLTISNGMTWANDQRTFYFIDSAERTVKAFDFDNQTGDISSGRTCIEVPPEMGVPDGMTIDREGKLWIAHWGGSCVGRWDAESGKLLEKIELPAPHVTSCTFGGGEMQTLYITTAREGLTTSQLEKFPLSGGVFYCRIS